MHFIIDSTFRSLGTNARNFESPHLPCQPLLINVLNMSKKGCSVYTNLLKKKKNLSSPLVERESRWHLELQTTFSTNFWNKTYKLTSEIKFENKIKWLQYQIVRNSLFTNYKVHKFKPHISPLCTFCSDVENPPHNELISHIFWDCLVTQQFWQGLTGWLGTLGSQITLDRKIVLFGMHEKSVNAKENFIILVSKYFIWKAKFTNKELSLELFKKYLYNKIEDLKNALAYANKDDQFNQWHDIYIHLLRLQSCSEQEAASLPLSQAPVITTPGIPIPHQALPAGQVLEADQVQAAAGTLSPTQAAGSQLSRQAQATGTQLPDQAPTVDMLSQEVRLPPDSLASFPPRAPTPPATLRPGPTTPPTDQP